MESKDKCELMASVDYKDIDSKLDIINIKQEEIK